MSEPQKSDGTREPSEPAQPTLPPLPGTAPRDPSDGALPVVAADIPQGDVGDLGDEVRDERNLLAESIGGWRGMIDSGLPSLVFIGVYTFNGQVLRAAVIAALATGVAMGVLRLIRRQPLTQVAGGLFGVGLAAFLANRSGKAEDFFLPTLLWTIGYLTVILGSILIRHPIVGYAVGSFRGDPTGWRKDPELRRRYGAATWIWVAVFALKLVLYVSFYLANNVTALGITKIVTGYPLYLVAGLLTYQVIRERPRATSKEAPAAAGEPDPPGTAVARP